MGAQTSRWGAPYASVPLSPGAVVRPSAQVTDPAVSGNAALAQIDTEAAMIDAVNRIEAAASPASLLRC